jgi:hypothetical protein
MNIQYCDWRVKESPKCSNSPEWTSMKNRCMRPLIITLQFMKTVRGQIQDDSEEYLAMAHVTSKRREARARRS